ncbi:MAG: phosphoribosylamine--glycine ligase [Clostridia bacterium]|nr:phosphoribosylamine--glycine ligase [Clostridia bacterium]
MKILVIGGGGREHAVIAKLSQSPKAEKIYCAPGNGGISKLAECADFKATDIKSAVAFAKEKNIDLVVVTPDDPLVLGMVDAMEKEGIRAFGPRANAAIIEGSKVFSKELMKKYGIPTAGYEVFTDPAGALSYIKTQNKFPAVIKADGLALGKGVIIAKDLKEAEAAVHTIMEDKIFGESGARVVIEEFMTGPEVSVLSFCDGKTVVPMVSAQDHKRAFDHDEGPNTGGMGTFSPSRIYTPEIADYCMEHIFKPTVAAMASEGREFRGVLYFGLMITPDGPKVVEYNARFGDPETQVVLPRLKTDLLDIMNACIDGTLDRQKIEWDDGACVCIVMASGGYPGKYETGFEISGIEDAESRGIVVYHAGTRAEGGRFYTKGGRVLGVTAKGSDLDDAIKRAYDGVKLIDFKNKHFRHDIGVK